MNHTGLSKRFFLGVLVIAAILFAGNAGTTPPGSRPFSAAKLLEISVEIHAVDSTGSGVIIRRGEDCYVLTCAHVIADAVETNLLGGVVYNSVAVIVPLEDQHQIIGAMHWYADILRYSQAEDLALLKIRQPKFGNNLAGTNGSGTVIFKINDQPPEIGADVYHVGCFSGTAGYHSLSKGIVSQINKTDSGTYFDQVSCSAFPGSSGGGVWLTDSTCIGLLDEQQAETFNYVIPARRIHAWAKRIGAEFIFEGNVPDDFSSGPIEEQPQTKGESK